MNETPLLKTLRKHAREHIEQGALTQGYQADRARVITLVNEALATETVCVLRYKRRGINADPIARRIVQLGGEPIISLRKV